MPTPPNAHALDPEQDSPGTSGFNTPMTTPSGQHTPAAGFRTATGTISNVFASLWGSYNHQAHSQGQQQQLQQQQQRESGPSRVQPPSSTHTPNDSPSPSVPGGWGNLLSWGPAAARQKTSTVRNSASPSRVGKARAAIPFSISAPLEADRADAVNGTRAPASPQRRGDTLSGPRLSPTSSPRRRPLAGVFEDIDPTSPPRTPASQSSASSPRSQFRELSHFSPSVRDESPNGAYATLSRLQSKPSNSKLRSGSGFLWPAAAQDDSTEKTASPAASNRPAANWSEALARAEKLDGYVRRIVFQAGLDYETRPMVVLAACCLPDPKEVDYDALLDRIMDTMDLFVENDYTVIYFAGGAHHRPGWNWIWRAYRRLDRRFRKNLKKLYIVHPTFFTRSLLQFVNTGAYFVSPKFNKKVSQLWTLSALAEHVPLTQIDIPPEVLQWNARYEKHVNLPDKLQDAAGEGGSDKVFGVDLAQLMGEYGEMGGVPRPVRDCVEAILGDFDGIRPAEGEGIFRRSPSSALLKTAQESYDRGHPVSLEQYRDPHIPAVLLKVFLRSLPRPIFAANLYPLIRACPPPPVANGDQAEAQAQETIEYLRTRLLPAIEPACSGILLSYVLEMLHKVSEHKEVNKMDASNLATVIAPNLVSSGNAIKDVMMCRVEGIANMAAAPRSPSTRKASPSSSTSDHNTTLGSIVRFCIERYYEIFDEMCFTPLTLNTVQDLVDDLGSESRSPSLASRVVYDTPASQIHSGVGLGLHRRGESTASSLVSEDSRSGLTGKSIASREGYRAPSGVLQRGTIGRNSSGSLRLTKGRLGSKTDLRGSFTAVVSKPKDDGADGLVSQLSGVALTGTSASGLFAAPEGVGTSPTTATAAGTVGVARRKSTRRELSEVAEADDDDGRAW